MPTFRAQQEFILPRRGRFLEAEENDGRRRGTKMLDSTALQCADRSAAGLLSGLASQDQIWVRDELEDRAHDLTHEERRWLDRLTEVKMIIFKVSDVYTQLYELFRECAAFGTGAALIYEDFENIIDLHVLTCGEYWLGTDGRGKHKDMFVRSSLTAEQAMDAYDLTTDSAPPQLGESIRQLQNTTRYTFMHYIGPNEQGSGGGLGQHNRPFIEDVYLEMSYPTGQWDNQSLNDERNFVRRAGFAYNPQVVQHWSRMGHDGYGRGPGMDSLGDASALQEMTKDKLRAIEYGVNPPMQGPPITNDRYADLLPGSYTPRNVREAADRITSLFDVNLDISHISIEIEQTRQRIRELFYIDVLATFLGQPKSIKTATEVDEMAAEKLTLFAPIAGRFIKGSLHPLNDITIQRMEQVGMFTQMGPVGIPPRSLQNREITYAFTGVLAQAQKAVRLGQLERFIMRVMELAEAMPHVIETIDEFELVDELRDLTGAPARILVDEDVREQRRQQREEAIAAQSQAATAREAAGAVQSLGNAQVGTGSGGQPKTALEEVVNQFGQAA